MVDLGGMMSGVSGWASGLMTNVIFWMVIAVVGFIVVVGGLYLRKKRLLDKVVIEWHCIGNGSLMEDATTTKGGWFKNKIMLNGLWDYGKERMFRLADMTPVFDISHNDYKRWNGKLCLHVVRNPNDPKFVIPLSKFKISPESREMMAEIAPVDLRNAGTAAIEETDIEMQTTWQKWAPLITIAILAFVLIFSILLIAQYGKHNTDATVALLKLAVEKQCGGMATAIGIPGVAP